MPGLLLEAEAAATGGPNYSFILSHQKLQLEVDFPTQTLKGYTELTILPQTRSLDEIKIDARQCIIPKGGITINGAKVTDVSYTDQIKSLDVPGYIVRGAEQYDLHRERIKPFATERGALEIRLPKSLRIEEVDPLSDAAAAAVSQRALGASAARHSSAVLDAATPTVTPKTVAEQSSRFQPLVVGISFTVKKFREGLHFAGLIEGDTQYPHVYTKHSIDAGIASCIFPCIDDSAMRCTWEIAITCSRTLGDAMKKRPAKDQIVKRAPANGSAVNGLIAEDDDASLSDEEKLLEMTVVCSGEQIHEVDDPNDSSKKIITFICSNVVAPQHIGFAIGPFEQIDLTEYREDEDGDKIGQGQSLPVFAYCLPGRSAEVKHVCLPMVHAVDWFMLNFGSYPFSDFSFLFVDGQVQDVEHTASLAICSDRLLYPQTIIDPEMETTRTLVHAIASQWIGVSIVANQKTDRWLTVGLSHFMADRFMQSLCGNNDYMFRQKSLSDKLVALDVERPSVYSLGEILHLGKYEMDFMKLKAPLVLFILDKRLHKATSTVGSLVRVLSKLITQANIGSAGDSVLSTEGFRRLVEKVAKWRQTEPFWNQWILGAGCPKFAISYKFNKKKISVELTISQKQEGARPGKMLDKESFSRDVKEELNGIYAGELQPIFTGSMTVRIHEADGTPYEHVLEITKATETFSIPYSTKYKRLKRNNRKKERLNAAAGDKDGEVNEDTLFFMLGDILVTEAEMKDWAMTDWDESEIKKMEAESFEWYRVDADFEWLCEKMDHMPGYMYISQLQQDRDIVAHQESMRYLLKHPFHPLVSTFLTRTVMDHRYFHGVRTMAVKALSNQATAGSNYIGMRQLEKACSEIFCYPDSMMPRTNDFSDRRSYNIELAIPHTMSRVRDPKGRCPRPAREFILDQLRFNDNSNNEYSDVFKIAGLMRALTTSLINIQGEENILEGDRIEDKDPEPQEFLHKALEHYEHYRRNDEYSCSYQNILTVTVLDSKKRLMQAGVIPVDRHEFLRYLVDGNLEQVRITAFTALVELGFLSDGPILRFLLCCMSSDPSPYVRNHLFEVFVLGLARVALDAERPKARKPQAVVVDGVEIDDGGLQIEENFEFNTEAMQAWVDRTTTIDGALAALKVELQENEVLKEALWDAIKSESTTFDEQTNILDICSLLYDPVDEMVIKLKLPCYWMVRHLGKGKLKFTKTNRVRKQPRKPKPKPKLVLAPPPPASAEVTAAPPSSTPVAKAPIPRPTGTGLTLSFGSSNSSSTPARQPLPQAAPPRPVVASSIAVPARAIVAPPRPVATPAPKSLKLVLTAKPTVKAGSVNSTSTSTKPDPAQNAILVSKPALVGPKITLPQKPQTAAQPPPANPGVMRPPKRPLEHTGEERHRPSKIVKLRVNSSRLKVIMSRAPRPDRLSAHNPAKKQKTASPAPARHTPNPGQSSTPRASPSPAIHKQSSIHRASPSPSLHKSSSPHHSSSASRPLTGSTIHASSPSSSTNGVAKPRQRLPDAAPGARPSSTQKTSSGASASVSSSTVTLNGRPSLKVKFKLGRQNLPGSPRPQPSTSSSGSSSH